VMTFTQRTGLRIRRELSVIRARDDEASSAFRAGEPGDSNLLRRSHGASQHRMEDRAGESEQVAFRSCMQSLGSGAGLQDPTSRFPDGLRQMASTNFRKSPSISALEEWQHESPRGRED